MQHFLDDEERYKKREADVFKNMEDLLDDERNRKLAEEEQESTSRQEGGDNDLEDQSKMSNTFDERKNRASTVPRNYQSNQYELGPTTPGSVNPS